MIDTYIYFENCKITNDEILNNYYKNMAQSLRKSKNGKQEVCFYLWAIHNYFENKADSITLDITYGKKGGQHSTYNFSKFCKDFFGFSQTQAYTYKNVYEKFLNVETVDKDMLEIFKCFDVSKLVELLPIDMELLKEDIPVRIYWTNTRDEIRQYVKKISAGGNENVDNSGENAEKDAKNAKRLAKIERKNQKFIKFSIDEEHPKGYYIDFDKEQLISIIQKFETAYKATKEIETQLKIVK